MHITLFCCCCFHRMAGGDLFDRLVRNGPIPELEAKFIAYQVLQALQVYRLFLIHL